MISRLVRLRGDARGRRFDLGEERINPDFGIRPWRERASAAPRLARGAISGNLCVFAAFLWSRFPARLFVFPVFPSSPPPATVASRSPTSATRRLHQLNRFFFFLYFSRCKFRNVGRRVQVWARRDFRKDSFMAHGSSAESRPCTSPLPSRCVKGFLSALASFLDL